MSKYLEEYDETVRNVIVESSSCSSDEESNHVDTQPRINFTEPCTTYTELDFDPDSFLSPPSIPELPNCVLSPLENVARGESTPHCSKRQR